MKLLIPLESALSANHKSNEKWIPCECCFCKGVFRISRRQVKIATKPDRKRESAKYCKIECFREDQKTSQTKECLQCGKVVLKKQSDLKKSRTTFCSRSCRATYHNQHKTFGHNRSKLEIWIEQQLKEKYPDIAFSFNDRDVISAEIDIYIPELKLAFELNGIFHYEPIFGQDKLGKIQNNDERKFAACQEKGISLCIIDASQQKYFKPKTSEKYLKIITGIIDSKTQNFS